MVFTGVSEETLGIREKEEANELELQILFSKKNVDCHF